MSRMKYRPTDEDPRPYLGNSLLTAITMVRWGSPQQKGHFRKRLEVLLRLGETWEARGWDLDYSFRRWSLGCEYGAERSLRELLVEAKALLSPPPS